MNVYFIFSIFIIISVSQAAYVDEIEQLISNLLNNYNKNIRPLYQRTHTVEVYTKFHIRTVNYYDEVAGVLSILGGLELVWWDYRLMWNPYTASNVTKLTLPRSDIWYPEVFATNSAADDLVPVANGIPISAKLNASGLVWLLLGDQIKFLCKSDMRYFPFDKQQCKVVFASWNFYTHDIYLKYLNPVADLSYFYPNNVWMLYNTAVEQYTEGEFSGFLQATLDLHRKPLYFCINMLAPLIALALLNPLAFIMPAESGERISYSVTIFLSFVVFMTLMSDYLPKSSTNMSYFSYFSFIIIFYSAIITIVTTLIMRLHHANQSRQVSSKLICFLDVLSLKILLKCLRKQSGNQVCDDKEKDGIPCDHDASPVLMSPAEAARKFDIIAFAYSLIFIVTISTGFLVLLATS